MPITGQLFIGFDRVSVERGFQAINPATRQTLPGEFANANPEHVARACRLAEDAFNDLRAAPLEIRASLLESAAERIGQLGNELLERAAAETGLPRKRLEGECARTIQQITLFARVIRQGDWLGLRIDAAQPNREPLPRCDLRLRKIPVGPVAVFGASNFPLAFSASGGDVVSALAAGCPVIVKAHPAHPGTSELVAGAIVEAVRQTGLPSGTYSHLSGLGHGLGTELARHPTIQAIAFTGSRQGGLALCALAAERAVPIPVYAEMSSVNPVIILPAALKTRSNILARAFVGSLTLGVGQFCTNPGIVMLVESPEAVDFIDSARSTLQSVAGASMLTEGIRKSYEEGVSSLYTNPLVTCHGRGSGDVGAEGVGALFSVRAADFMQDERMGEEVFGPSALVIRCNDVTDFVRVIAKLGGQLTATLHMDPEDYPLGRSLLPLLERKVGRILANGWPTGVEVAPAMVHGGPFPATSAGGTTSVGTLAIERFLRPVCYQDMPPALLPDELHDQTVVRHRRMIEGEYENCEV